MKPLENILVVSLEQAVAAPFCSVRLADAGARVIKIERSEGDFARYYDKDVKGESANFVWLNRGKESLVADPDPVIFYEHKSLYPVKEEISDTNFSIPLGKANILHNGSDACIISLGLMAQRSVEAAKALKEKHDISITVIDLRCLVPLDLQLIKREVKKSGIIFTVEENPRLCGWGAEISSIIAEQCFHQLKSPITRITTPHIPIPSADILENNTIPSTELIVETLVNKIKKK